MITLNHFLRGPLKVVAIKSEPREWFCPDRPMLRPMGDGEFRETRDQIDALLASANDRSEAMAEAVSQSMREQQSFAAAFSQRPWR